MKKIVKRNQMVLTVLAVMIAVAGYLTYAGNQADSIYTAATDEQASEQAAGNNFSQNVLTDLSDEDILAENIAREQANGLETQTSLNSENESETQDVFTDEIGEETQSEEAIAEAESETLSPGDAVLTNSSKIADFIAEVKLNREKIRSSNKDTLNAIINNESLSKEQKQKASDRLVNLTQVEELETTIENLLSAKGLENTVVTVGDENVDVVVGLSEITDAQRAQIEDVVKRKAEVKASEIVITLMDK